MLAFTGIVCLVVGMLTLVAGPVPDMRVHAATAIAAGVAFGLITVFLVGSPCVPATTNPWWHRRSPRSDRCRREAAPAGRPGAGTRRDMGSPLRNPRSARCPRTRHRRQRSHPQCRTTTTARLILPVLISSSSFRPKRRMPRSVDQLFRSACPTTSLSPDWGQLPL